MHPTCTAAVPRRLSLWTCPPSRVPPPSPSASCPRTSSPAPSPTASVGAILLAQMLVAHGMHNGMWLLLRQQCKSNFLTLDLFRRPQQVQYPAFPTTTIGSFPQVSCKCRRLLQSIKLGQGCGVMCLAPIVRVPGRPSLLRLPQPLPSPLELVLRVCPLPTPLQTPAIRRTRLAYKKGRIRWGWEGCRPACCVDPQLPLVELWAWFGLQEEAHQVGAALRMQGRPQHHRCRDYIALPPPLGGMHTSQPLVSAPAAAPRSTASAWRPRLASASAHRWVSVFVACCPGCPAHPHAVGQLNAAARQCYTAAGLSVCLVAFRRRPLMWMCWCTASLSERQG